MDTDLFGLLEEIYRESRMHGIPAIDEKDGYALAALAFSAPRVGLVLDLGAGVGYSTLWLAIGVGAWKGMVVAVEADPSRAARLEKYSSKIADATGARIEVIRGDALAFLESLPASSVSLAFVDIEKHEYLGALQLLAGVGGPRRLVEGGFAAFHNAYFPAPPREFFEEASRYEAVTLPTPAGLLVVKIGG